MSALEEPEPTCSFCGKGAAGVSWDRIAQALRSEAGDDDPEEDA